jgi:hypothetical protein
VIPLLAHASGADESLSLVMLFSGIWIGWIGWSRVRGKGFLRLPRWGGWTTIGAAAGLVVCATFLPRMLVGPAAVSAATGPRPTSTATLRFTAPRDGLTTSQDELTVGLDLEGATITAVTSTSVTPDTGHVHLSLDGSLVSMSGGALQVIDLRNVAPGAHTLTAEFVASDHLPFNPPVIAQVTFDKAAG